MEPQLNDRHQFSEGLRGVNLTMAAWIQAQNPTDPRGEVLQMHWLLQIDQKRKEKKINKGTW